MSQDGFYVFTKPGYQMLNVEARRMIRQLVRDAESDTPQVHWGHNPDRSNLSAFLGEGYDGGRYCLKICKELINGNTQLTLECCEGNLSCYTIVDLCHEPEKSELLRLHTQVAKKVYAEAIATRKLTAERTIRFG